jgi:hypothetical protein
MDEGIILSLRGVAAACILDDYHVTPRHKVIDVVQRCRRCLVVWHPHENDREHSGGIRPMDVGIERDSIPHLRWEITLDHDAILRLAHGWMFRHGPNSPGKVLRVEN